MGEVAAEWLTEWGRKKTYPAEEIYAQTQREKAGVAQTDSRELASLDVDVLVAILVVAYHLIVWLPVFIIDVLYGVPAAYFVAACIAVPLVFRPVWKSGRQPLEATIVAIGISLGILLIGLGTRPKIDWQPWIIRNCDIKPGLDEAKVLAELKSKSRIVWKAGSAESRTYWIHPMGTTRIGGWIDLDPLPNASVTVNYKDGKVQSAYAHFHND